MLPCITLARAAVSLPHSDLSKLDFDALEIDWFEWLGLSDRGRTRKAAQLKRMKREIILTTPARWISTQLNSEVRDERLEQLHHWQEQMDIKRIHATLSHATQTTDLPNVKSLTAFEPGRVAVKMPGNWARVIDPFHEFGTCKEASLPARVPRTFPQGAYLKVHGWHPERWIRRYSREAIDRLAQWSILSGATHICLAHSQRIEQLPELREALARAAESDLKI